MIQEDDCSTNGLLPFFKEKGFRKKGQNFCRTNISCLDASNIQKSQWNTDSDISFCINLGIYWPEVEKRFSGNEIATFPKPYDCTVSTRLGQLSHGHDMWWEITPQTDIEILAHTVLDALAKYGMEWLDKGHDPKMSVKYLEERGKAYSLKRETMQRWIDKENFVT